MSHALLTPQVIADQDQYRGYLWKYGYGNWFMLNNQHEVVRYGHPGEEDGASCRLYYYPKPNLDLIILGNHSQCAGTVSWEIHDLIMEMYPRSG
jgi:hypothetical protein